ncbi:MAG: Exopolyphosphatase-related protein [Microgenomates group bacterium GW2011_GWA2_47_8]|nr:MAG: Exopolyphosphatase-related protein [Microgenomates group bacterium GW2011_GWA2_47_8]
MDLQAEIAKVKELLAKAQDVLVVTHEQPSPDSTGSTLALLLGLVSLGKKVTVACPDPMTVALSSFVGVNKVVSQLARKNFVISLDYVDGSIEKVSYNIEGNKFNLVIEPRPGFDTFSQDKVHYAYAGVAAQAIFIVDTIHLGGLKKLYEEDKELFAGKPIVNVDRHPNNTQFGQINVVDPVASSTAEVMARLLSALGVKLTQDIATNLLNAVYGATNNFTVPNITASAFDVASVCIKAGGKRFSDIQEPKVQEEVPVKSSNLL